MSETRGRKPPELPRQERREIVGRFDFGSAQVQGPRHGEQQDYCTVRFFLDSKSTLIALVADGVGSAKHAADASRMAGELFVAEVGKQMERDGQIDVEKAAQAVNIYLLSESRRKIRELERSAAKTGQKEVDFSSGAYAYETAMETTFTGIVVQNEKIVSAHLGDSRLYLFSNGLLTKMTEDQTLAENLREQGATSIKPEDESTITNCLGVDDASFVIDEYKAVAGDAWLLVSDGVYAVLTDDELQKILSQQKDAQSLADDIIEAVKAKGVADDATAVVVKVK